MREIQQREPKWIGTQIINNYKQKEFLVQGTPVTVKKDLFGTPPTIKKPVSPPPPPLDKKEEDKKTETPNKDEAMSKGVLDAMGKRGWQVGKLKEDQEDRFFDINKLEFEDPDILPFRKEIWDWCVESVKGVEGTGFCAHLIRETDRWDIYHLYKNVKKFLNTENYLSFGRKLENFFAARPKDNEDVFTYMSRLDQLEEEVGRFEDLAKEAGESLVMPKFYKTWKILSILDNYPQYNGYVDKLQNKTPQEWIKMKPEQIRHELHLIHSNQASLQIHKQKEKEGGAEEPKVALQARRAPPPPPPTTNTTQQTQKSQHHGGYTRRSSHSRTRTPTPTPSISDKLKHHGCPEGVCLGYHTHGRCPRISKGMPCRFSHGENGSEERKGRERASAHHGTVRSKSHSPVSHNNTRGSPRAPPPPARRHSISGGGSGSGGMCGTCGGAHTGTCKWNKPCFMCGGAHAARVCQQNKEKTYTFGQSM